MDIVTTEDAPRAIGTYSQGVKHGGFLFISGQVPFDPTTMKVVSPDPVDQIRQVLKNLKAIADAAGADLNNAVKLTVYLKDLGIFASLNEEMAAVFNKPYPARVAVEVSRLPGDVLVEIDAIIATD